MNRRILHLFVEGNQVQLPFISSLEKISVVYVHVEFEKQTLKDYVKLCCNFVSICNNSQGIISAFYQPPRVKDSVFVPQFKQQYTVIEKYSDLNIRVVTDKENKVKRCYIQLEIEQATN